MTMTEVGLISRGLCPVNQFLSCGKIQSAQNLQQTFYLGEQQHFGSQVRVF